MSYRKQNPSARIADKIGLTEVKIVLFTDRQGVSNNPFSADQPSSKEENHSKYCLNKGMERQEKT